MKMKEFGPPGGARVPGAPPWIRQWVWAGLLIAVQWSRCFPVELGWIHLDERRVIVDEFSILFALARNSVAHPCRISLTGRAQPIVWPNVYQKLHENRRNCTKGWPVCIGQFFGGKFLFRYLKWCSTAFFSCSELKKSIAQFKSVGK